MSLHYGRRSLTIFKEELVRPAVDVGHPLILNTLQQEYPEKYPRVCGSYGIGLTRSPWFKATDIPLQLGGDCERLELEIGIFNPPSSEPFEPGEHTYIRYYTGNGGVLYIDGIYPLLWGRGKAPTRPIIDRYREDEIDDALAKSTRSFRSEKT